MHRNTADKAMDEITNEVVRVEQEEPEVYVDFEMLHQVNPDIYAWIIVPNTNINYPVFQSPEGEDTDYYLNRNIDGSLGYPGSIYTQLRNSKDFTDPVTIVYGHNMKNKSMFANLHEFKNQKFFEQNQYVYFYTERENLVYKIFAVSILDDRLILDYYDDFKNVDDEIIFLEEVRNKSVNFDEDTNIDVERDKIIGLSTCMANSPNERLYIFAKKLSSEEVDLLNVKEQQVEMIKRINLHEN